MKKRAISKLLVGVSLVLVLALALPFMSGCAKEEGERVYKIGIAQYATHPALDACRDGFIDQMEEEGFVEGENIEYDILNAEGDMTVAATIAQQFVSEQVDLIYSIATPITMACVAATEGTDIPIVFTAVTDPVTARIVDSWDKPGGTVTGMSDWIEIDPQLEMILEIVPDIEKLGTVYNAGEVNSLVQVAELMGAASDFGIDSIVTAPVATTADVMTAAQSLVGRVDAIWVPTDNTVVSAFEAVVGVCEDNQIPLFAADVSSAERGAIAAMGFSYYDSGKDACKLAIRILEGEDPANISVGRPGITGLGVNLPAADRMGVTIPQSILDRATVIVEE